MNSEKWFQIGTDFATMYWIFFYAAQSFGESMAEHLAGAGQNKNADSWERIGV
jgi:hypothetical protein